MPDNTTSAPTLYTVGHSNHSEQAFLELLSLHGIEILVDVRSAPYSRYNPHFNDKNLQHTVESAGMQYLYMGDQLGGRPEGADFYDDEGHALYHRMAESPEFLTGIERIEQGIQKYRVALMCSEENPTVCHRHLLVTRVANARGIDVVHIRGDGRPESERVLTAGDNQGMLFAEMMYDSWKSLRSVAT